MSRTPMQQSSMPQPPMGQRPANRPPTHRLVQEQDAGEVVEYLPPQYREDWQERQSSGSAPRPVSQDPSSSSSSPVPSFKSSSSLGPLVAPRSDADFSNPRL